MSTFRKAERKRGKIRCGIMGPSGSGKTYSALLIAQGLVGPDGKVAVIDTENSSAELYSDVCDYDVATLDPPFEPKRFIQLMHDAEQAGYGVIIIDSLSHAWSGTGGVLDIHGKIADRGTNSFAAWRDVTPQHNALVDAILRSPAHIIATMRTKTEYVIEENDRGKKVPKKVGMAPEQRAGMEYEFTIVLDLDQKHNAQASKTRIPEFDGTFFTPSKETGQKLVAWLNGGAESPAPQPTTPSGDDSGAGRNLDSEPITPAQIKEAQRMARETCAAKGIALSGEQIDATLDRKAQATHGWPLCDLSQVEAESLLKDMEAGLVAALKDKKVKEDDNA